jgi:hypothetical protein
VKILKSALKVLLALAVCGLPAIASAQTVFNPRHPVTELHAPIAGGSHSFAAAAVMGAQGFSNAPTPPDFDTFITSGCTAKTKSLAAPPIGTGSGPLSVWPATCNPDGMALFLNQFSPPNPVGQPAVHWITVKSTDQAFIINELIRGLKEFGSPGILPVYGQADHWVAVTQVTVNSVGAISNVRAFDGGVIGGMDSGTNSYFQGLQSWSGISFRNTFFVIVTAINPACDNVVPGGCGAPPVSDPFANKFVLMYEPPAAATRGFSTPYAFAATPGISGKGTMTAAVASARVFDALVAGGVSADATMWNGLRAGTPGQAVLVNGVWPSGAARDYYLVPILSSKDINTAVGFVHLSAADGSFESVNLLNNPVPYTPVTQAQAQELAGGVSGGGLTWNPRASSAFSKSPNEPYYEFATKSGIVRVRLNDGKVDRQ